MDSLLHGGQALLGLYHENNFDFVCGDVREDADIVFGIYCRTKELTDSEVELALRSITLDDTEASKPEKK